MRRAAVVLVYLRIVDAVPDFLDYAPSGMTVTQADFEAQMRYLLRHYRVVPLEDIATRVSLGQPLDDSMCAVTFDDGWRDNYTHAFPVLRALNVPATIFLATHFIDGHPWFWEERAKYVLGHLHQRYGDGALDPATQSAVERLLEPRQLGTVLRVARAELPGRLTAVVNDLRTVAPEVLSAAMAALEAALQLPGLHEPRRFMTWDEVREMAAAGITFGAHTASHENLERCDLSTADAEMRRSRDVIAAQIGRAPQLFAYPYGKHTLAVRQLAEQVGFASALTTGPGLIREGDDRMGLNRIDIHGRVAPSIPFFACRALRVLNAY
jgi:peptidoglycan/xylan/chitin deacetylase (PgdA/CDA1 family)